MPIYLDSLADQLKPQAGRPWRPSNGFEGDLFTETVCARCAHRPDDQPGCDINLRAWWFDIGDDDYPTEWQIGQDGQPSCTAYRPVQQEQEKT